MRPDFYKNPNLSFANYEPYQMEFQAAQQLIIRNDVDTLKSLPDKNAILRLRHQKSGDTLIHVCCKFGNEEVLAYLIKELNADIEVSNYDGKRPLHDAAQYSQLGCLHILLAHQADTNALKRADWTPLMLACTKQSYEVVHSLVCAGANPSLRNKDGWNSFHLASREGQVSILSLLLSHDADIWNTKSNNLRTPLHTVAMHGCQEAVTWMLSECKYEPDAQDSCGVTPFMDALRMGHVDLAKTLLDTGQILLDREDQMGRQAIHHVVQTGQRSSLQYLVKELGISPDTLSGKDKGTPLHVAARDGQRDTMEELLKLGTNINAVDIAGRTALAVARACYKKDCVTLLMENGAKDDLMSCI